MFNIILFGPPGSGKGTQSAKIAAHYNLVHLSTGEMFRKEIARNTVVGKEAHAYISKGMLVPDAVTLRLLYKHASKYLGTPGIILDGFPRTINQAILLDRMLEKKGEQIDLVIQIKVDEAELVRRIKHRSESSDRSDDTENIIHKRMEIYRRQTYPVLNYFSSRNKLESVSGMASTATVFGRICAIIDTHRKEKQA